MNNRTINKVRVIVDFPGYKEGDVLELDPKAGVFHFTNVTMEDGAKGDAFDVFAARITGDIKPSITKKEILSYMDSIFEDISTYKVRSFIELGERMEEIKAQMKRIEEDETMDHLNTTEALTVWQNMLWEYEWIMGMRDLYHFTVADSCSETESNQDVAIENLPIDGILANWVDGNELEKQNDEANDSDKYRESC